VSLFTSHGGSSAPELVVDVLIQCFVVICLAEIVMRKMRLTRSWVQDDV